MGQSVQLLMVTLRPGSERGVGAGDVARAAGRGQRVTRWPERAVLGPPPAVPMGEDGRQTARGLCAQLRMLTAGRGCSRGPGVPQELHRGEGGTGQGGDGEAQLCTVPQPKKGLKGVTGVRWFSHLRVLQRTETPQRRLQRYRDSHRLGTESYNHSVN